MLSVRPDPKPPGCRVIEVIGLHNISNSHYGFMHRHSGMDMPDPVPWTVA